MNAETFDAFTRLVARPASRRRILQGAALGVVAAATTRRAHAQDTDATALVQRFYENVNAYQYEQAYALLGSSWQGRQSLAALTKGYANTAFVQCDVTGTDPADNGATTVRVRLISWHNDGKIFGYTGGYTVGVESGELLILDGANTPGLAPADTRPLCTVDDVTLAFGSWDAGAGSRNGAVVATNTGADTCVLGGSPRLTLTAPDGEVLRSTSLEGSPPEGIVLGAGDSAQAPLRFGNWCNDEVDPSTITTVLPGGDATGSIDSSEYGISYPPCLGEGQPALLEIRGWVAGAQ